MATICIPSTLAQDHTWDCLPRDQQERLAFNMIRWIANEVELGEIDVDSEAPCEWNRFSERQKWSVILYALCAILVYNDRSYTCTACRDQLPGDFLALNRDDQVRAWLALLNDSVEAYDEGGEFDAWLVTNDQPCRDHKWYVNVLLNIALQFLEFLSYDTDPDYLMCSDNNPYWNVKEQDIPAWLFQLMCDLYNQVLTPD